MNSVSTVTKSALARRAQNAASSAESAINRIDAVLQGISRRYQAICRTGRLLAQLDKGAPMSFCRPFRPAFQRPYPSCMPIGPIPAASCAPPCRPDGAPVRLGAPQARPRPAAVRRPARPLRHHAMRDRHRRSPLFAEVDGAAPRKRRVGHRARSSSARPDTVNPKLADRRDRAGDRRVRGAVGGRAAAVPGQQRRRYPEELRLRYRFLDLRASGCTPTSCCARRSSRRSAGA